MFLEGNLEGNFYCYEFRKGSCCTRAKINFKIRTGAK